MENPTHTPLVPLSAVHADAVLIDCRDPESFDAAHIPGSINLPFAPCEGVAGAVSWLARLDARVAVAVTGDSEDEAADMAACLSRCGIDCLGVLDGGIRAWKASGRPLRSAPAIDLARADRELRLGGVALVDVRPQPDWEACRVPGSINAPLPEFPDRQRRLPRLPLLVASSTASFAAVAASLARAAGHPVVWRIRGGGIDDMIARGSSSGGL